jgi:hypothetical protein
LTFKSLLLVLVVDLASDDCHDDEREHQTFAIRDHHHALGEVGVVSPGS